MPFAVPQQQQSRAMVPQQQRPQARPAQAQQPQYSPGSMPGSQPQQQRPQYQSYGGRSNGQAQPRQYQQQPVAQPAQRTAYQGATYSQSTGGRGSDQGGRSQPQAEAYSKESTVEATPYQPQQSYGPPAQPGIPDVRQPFYSGDDPAQMIRNDRQRAAAQGDMTNRRLENFQDTEDWYRQNYRARGDNAFAEIGEGRGGYRPGEQADIIGREGLDASRLTPQQRQSLFMTEGEQGGNIGDTNRAEGWFDPEGLDTINTEGNARINEATNQGAAGLREAYGRGASGLRGSYDPSALRLRGNYGADVNSSLSGTEGNVRGILDRDRLTQSQDFVDRYRMTDRDVDDYTQDAALRQGQINQGRVGAIQRAAAAAGGGSPLALAAGLNRLSATSDQQGQDAALRAKIAARGEQAGREKDIEGMRLGAEGDYAGMASGAELDLGARRYGATRDTEGMRLDSESGVADRGIGVERTLGDRELGVAGDIAGRGYDAADSLYRNNTDNARYRGETGAALARGTDDRNVERSRYNSAQRRDDERYAQESEYNRGQAAGDRLSSRTIAAAAPRLSQEQEYRNYLTGQQQLANNNVTDAFGNIIRNNGQTGNLVQGSTGQASQYDLARRAGSFGGNFARSFGSALGGFLGNPAGAVSSSRRAIA